MSRELRIIDDGTGELVAISGDRFSPPLDPDEVLGLVARWLVTNRGPRGVGLSTYAEHIDRAPWRFESRLWQLPALPPPGCESELPAGTHWIRRVQIGPWREVAHRPELTELRRAFRAYEERVEHIVRMRKLINSLRTTEGEEHAGS